MGRRDREEVGTSTRVFVRPVMMLAVGLAAGMVMWLVLMADDRPSGSRDEPRLSASHGRFLGPLLDQIGRIAHSH